MRVDLFKCCWKLSRSACGTTLGRAVEAMLRTKRERGRAAVVCGGVGEEAACSCTCMRFPGSRSGGYLEDVGRGGSI